jgi:hypothetical protein
VKGIEPSYEAWEAAVLPLNYTRTIKLLIAATPFPELSIGQKIKINTVATALFWPKLKTYVDIRY